MKIKSLRSSGAGARPMRKPLATAVAAACGVSAVLIMPQAVAQETLEEIIVTATKRAEGVQDIPMSVMVMGEQQLEDLNITDMADYLQMLPNVSYIATGPASGNIYIRGISSGGESSLGANPSRVAWPSTAWRASSRSPPWWRRGAGCWGRTDGPPAPSRPA